MEGMERADEGEFRYLDAPTAEGDGFPVLVAFNAFDAGFHTSSSG